MTDRHRPLPPETTSISALRRAVFGVALALLAGACGNGLEDAERSARNDDTATTSTTTTEPSTTSTTEADPATSTSTTADPPATSGSSTSTTAANTVGSDGFPAQWVPPILNWSSCGSLECATLTVPLDWSKPEGTTIDLALAKSPASGDRKGSVLTNPGGPGGSGIEFVQQGVLASGAFADLHGSYDILGWDPRGVGNSEAVDCGDNTTDYLHLDSDPDDAAEQTELDNAAQAVATQCGALDPELLANISTDDSVMDMEAIRRTIGDEGLTFYGFSYGTTLGSVYADRFPDKARAIVLDGVTDPSQDLEGFLAAQTAAFERQLTSILSNCGGLETCPVEDPAALFDEVAGQLENSPLTVADGKIGPAELSVAAVAVTYVDGAELDLIPGLVDAKNGDGETLAYLADIYYGVTEFDPYLAIECVDQPHPVGNAEWEAFADRLAGISPRIGGSVANELLPCANWPVPVARTPKMPTAPGAPPILVVGNSGDAATPIEQAVKMAESLESGILVTSEGLGHTSYGNSCVDKITSAYLLDLKTPSPGTTC